MNLSAAMDEKLINEVQNHAVIYNRQKYFLHNGSARYENKDEAWSEISIKLGSDVETCKKRWKYLRERYVQQRKQQPDTPTYEHLSRPYLEKMKFLDDHIQPRKSYRNVSNFLHSSSGNNANFGEYIDSSRSNGSLNGSIYANYHENFNTVKSEPEKSFHDFPTSESVDGQQSQQQQQQHVSHNSSPFPLSTHDKQHVSQNPEVPPLSSSRHHHNMEFRESGGSASTNIPSSSSSLKSPLSSPPVPEPNDHVDCMKRPRVDVPQDSIGDGDSSNNDESPIHNNSIPRYLHTHRRNSVYPNNLLYSMYQQFPESNQVRCTEQLFGELVTSELLKMNREKRRIAQKRILEVLFFDD